MVTVIEGFGRNADIGMGSGTGLNMDKEIETEAATMMEIK